MKKQISKDLILYYNNNFPFKCKKRIKKKNIVTLGIGGNIGNVIRRFNLLFLMLKSNFRIKIIKTSPILKNPPFGYKKQDDFYNAIIQIQTILNPFEVLRLCWQYENRFKRTRSFKDAPRTLDIDIITICKNNIELKISTEDLIVPHKDYKNRVSVTIPLKFI